MDNILSITNISKYYENLTALNDVSLNINKGAIFGLLGPNGAGKTTLIRILTGINLPDKGSFTLAGTDKSDFNSLSRLIGYLPEERGLYQKMKVIEQLEFFGAIKGLHGSEAKAKIMEYSEKLGITDWHHKKARELSKGMQQMVQFVATIFFEPELIILDEPFTGLDPINTNKMKAQLTELKQAGKTIIFSTHRMEQVEEICESIALINKGKIILEGSIAEIKQQFKKNIYKVIYSGTFDHSITTDFDVLENTGDTMIIKENCGGANTLLKKLVEIIEVHSFIELLPSLNEIFIEQVNSTSAEQEVANG